jgi:hypothetical protein
MARHILESDNELRIVATGNLQLLRMERDACRASVDDREPASDIDAQPRGPP